MPNLSTNPIPARLIQARRELGLTQEQVAGKVGLSRNSIARYERGEVGPSPVALNMLASLYAKPVSWFFSEEEEEGIMEDNNDISVGDPELALFFRGEWEDFTDEEKEFIKAMIRDSKELLKKRRESGA